MVIQSDKITKTMFFHKFKLRYKLISAFIILLSLYVVGFILFIATCPHLAIINRISKDRFGDQIITYGKTKWLSYKHKIPFLLVPFKKSNKLRLHTKEKQCSHLEYYIYPFLYTIYGNYVKVRTENDIIEALKRNSKHPTLFISRINTKLQEHLESKINCKNTAWISSLLYELMLQNPNFAKNLKYMLQPQQTIKKLDLPKDKFTVAIHIRKGGGFDPKLKSEQYYNTATYNTKYEEIYLTQNNRDIKHILENTPKIDDRILIKKNFSDQIWPEKFPPEQYYIEQIKKLSKILCNQPIYAHIFTDDKDPKQLKKMLKEKVKLNNIKFSYNKHNRTVLQDCFAMTQFDGLIRSMSGFAYLAQLLGNHKIIMYPIHLTWVNQNLLTVDKVGIISKR